MERFDPQRFILRMLTLILVLISAQTHAESLEREFVSHALALRQSALEGGQQFSDVMNQMPGSRIMDSEVLSYLWSLSFSNMIVKLGRHRSEAPVSLYYDPLLDIAVLIFWEQDGEGYHVKFARALPGTWLGSGIGQSSVLPPWISDENALLSLIRSTSERFEVFSELHPPGAVEGGMNDATFAEAAAGLRAVTARLIWNADQQAQWTEPGSSYQWLAPMLEEIERALSSSDVQKIVEVAPETDLISAESLAQLPSRFIDEIRLDLVAGSSENRLLIASSAADGDTYIMVMCQVSASLCRPNRLMLLSLAD